MKPKFEASGDGLERLRELAEQLKINPEIQLGVLSDQASGLDGLTMAELAAIHEFGAPRANVPERSFLRATADEKQREWLTLLERALTQAVRGRLDVETALQIIAQRAVADVQAKIRSNIPPELAPETVRRKGSTVALIDSGRLLQSISASVVRGK